MSMLFRFFLNNFVFFCVISFLQKYFAIQLFKEVKNERMGKWRKHTKKQCSGGTGVLILYMGNDPQPIPQNTRGTVENS